MYGVESFVHPEYQGNGVGAKLMQARFDVARKLNLRGLVAGSLIIGYGDVADQMSVDEYVKQVAAGTRFDPNLSKQLRKGFKVRNLIPEYTYEPRTLNYAVAILWDNPDYMPAKAAVAAKVMPSRYGTSRGAGAPASAVGS
jgi:hypothetical protein